MYKIQPGLYTGVFSPCISTSREILDDHPTNRDHSGWSGERAKCVCELDMPTLSAWPICKPFCVINCSVEDNAGFCFFDPVFFPTRPQFFPPSVAATSSIHLAEKCRGALGAGDTT